VFCRLRLPVLVIVAFAEVACQKKTAGPQGVAAPRYAVLRFENLSGDPSLDWVGRAASETLAFSLANVMDGAVLPSSAITRSGQLLGPRPRSVPGVSSERQEAMVAGANRLISGYLEKGGDRIRITAIDEAAPTRKTLRIVSAEDSSVSGALSKVAQQLSQNAKPLPTSNMTALRLYATVVDSSNENGAEALAEATRLDPGFGPAWVGLANLNVAKGDRAAAEAVIDQARTHKLDALSMARLDLESAGLQTDQTVRIEALRKVAYLSSGDTALLRTLAEAETAAGQFKNSAADWKRLTAVLPDDPSAWNGLGYAYTYAGDYQGALAALQEYAKLRPNDPNALDSIGDLNYWFRKFKEAADAYAQAAKMQPDFQRYGDLYKGAWSKFNAGDKAGADALFAQFRAAREKLGDMSLPLISADWLYRTGRQPEAFDSLRRTVAQTTSEPVRMNGYAQLTIWDLIGHDRAQAAKDAVLMGPKITDNGMMAASFAALPSASPDEWEARSERFPPAAAGLRPVALGYALLLDGKRDAAAGVWGKVVEKTPATDFLARAIYARLQGKILEHPLVPDPASFNLFLAVLYSL
jgi:tetratricopeptide (TPR) repeat protein